MRRLSIVSADGRGPRCARRSTRWVWAATAVMAVGCAVPDAGRTPLSLLEQPRMSPDAVVLEVLYVRVPYGDAEINGPMWAEIDEQRLPTELRRRLLRNGARCGLLTGRIPSALSQVLGSAPASVADAETDSGTRLDADPIVRRQRMQLRSGRPGRILTSRTYDELPLLVARHTSPVGTAWDVGGEYYPKAQCLLTATAYPQADGRVRLDLLPQIEYGDPRQRLVPTEGLVRVEAGRPTESFDQLRVETILMPGEMLLLSAVADRPGSLGHHFFTDDSSGTLQQKLIILRLAQTQYDDTFDLPGDDLPGQ